MSWHCSRALVEEFSGAISSGGDASAPSNTTPTPDQFYWPDKTTEHSRLSRFGMTCAPLTADRGEALLTWFLAGFPVKTSALPGEVMASTASGLDSGEKWSEWWLRYDRETSTWRTRQLSLAGGLAEFSETWPRSGSMRNGGCWERQTWAPPIKGTASGSWPTPRSSDKNGPGLHGSGGMDLRTAVHLYPTPQASDNRDRGNRNTPAIKRRIDKGKQVMLSMCVSDLNGRLNPRWVEWLMGWPIGQTSLQPLGTGKSRCAQQWLGDFSAALQRIAHE